MGWRVCHWSFRGELWLCWRLEVNSLFGVDVPVSLVLQKVALSFQLIHFLLGREWERVLCPMILQGWEVTDHMWWNYRNSTSNQKRVWVCECVCGGGGLLECRVFVCVCLNNAVNPQKILISLLMNANCYRWNPSGVFVAERHAQ